MISSVRPLVSVIIPSYNRRESIQRAIHSVFSQTYKHFELIVVDDGSTDGTWEALLPYHQQSQIRLIGQHQLGVSAARNCGVRAAQGEWLAFLDSDDEWLEDKLLRQVDWALQNWVVPIIHGEEIWIRNGVRVNQRKKHQKKGGWIFTDALKLCCMSPSSIMIRRDFFEEFGGFREDFPVCEDYHLWLHMTSQTPVGFIEDPVVVKYGGHEDQLSRKYVAMDYYRILSIADVLRTRKLSDVWRKEALQELKRKSDILLKGYQKHNNMSQYEKVLSIQNEWCQ